jgi:GT2 family glycosyltransferase
VLRAVGGFSPDYFVYFEDYDLSVRLGRRASLAFVPAVRITHAGGNTARVYNFDVARLTVPA